ncbi:MAG: helix-turn-helix domain-containing protein [Candidatus Nitrosocosmicus sp.]
MSNPVPHRIKLKVLSEWIQGIPRDKIARINGISSGSVSGIIQQLKINDPDIDLMRLVATNLKKKNISLFEHAATSRIRNFLTGCGISEDQIEKLFEDIVIHCYRLDIPEREFLSKINEVSELSEYFETPIQDIPFKITNLKNELEEIKREVKSKRQQLNQVLKENNTTIEILKQYIADRPTFDRVKHLEAVIANQKRIIHHATEELNELVDENEKLKSLLRKEEVFEDKFTDINKNFQKINPLGQKNY